MTRNKYDLTVFIGRFSPLHKGHETVIFEALKNSDCVLVLVGSSFRPRSERNPFTFEERKNMIQTAFDDSRVIVEPLEDITYNDKVWEVQVQDKVKDILANNEICKHSLNPRVALIGYKKDYTSYYVDMFPQWDSISVDPYTPEGRFNAGKVLNASDIRSLLLKQDQDLLYFLQEDVISKKVLKYILNLDITDAILEYSHNIKYKKQFSSWPYPGGPVHQTVDTIVVQSGHILLVERGAMPGKGLWALPGGFINNHEKLLDAAIRELREETKIKIPEPVLRGSIRKSETFDDPHRSTRGRTITRVFYIEMPNGPLPKVKGSDDAKKAFWVPLSELSSDKLFEDHYDIIQVMTGVRNMYYR